MDPIVEMRFISHLYGTATPRSDFDLKAVYLPEARDILLQRMRPTVSFSPDKPGGERKAPGGAPIVGRRRNSGDRAGRETV